MAVYHRTVNDAWNAGLYQKDYGFVWQFGRDVIGLLEPKAGERILDVGCGTGQLTGEIARTGADVIGVDRSPAMIAEAQANFPGLRFAVEDIRALPFRAEFDAVFSNAALHWVKPPEQAAASMSAALKPGGRLVAEFGGRGNIGEIQRCANRAWETLGSGPLPPDPWFYPSIAEYSAMLEQYGLEVTFAVLFERPTPLDHGSEGLSRWCEIFGSHWLAPLTEPQRAAFVVRAADLARPRLFRDGQWVADYRRLRIVAKKV
jgi:SAM-dependent methyltransferase